MCNVVCLQSIFEIVERPESDDETAIISKLAIKFLFCSDACGEAHARGDIAGDWQGTLPAGKSLRIILKITKTDKGWSAKMYSIDQASQPINASSVTLDGSTFKYSVALIGGSYEGTLSADGNTIVGSWTQGPSPLPLTLVRATKETAWEIPIPPPPPKPIAADANPSFEVATVKPSKPEAQGLLMTFMQNRSSADRNGSTKTSSTLPRCPIKRALPVMNSGSQWFRSY